ncbi:hypothetical protein [Marinibactrum halimedae]|uniref:Uncharacterized protein n=1 Tax=Marinibactrum halimedae TaxID=1444977 RepID=A0AA37T6N2_9GAMM|nr:hypothetical protein [Marinibactrum halimedae]GLS28283.1 hypothetical protein GCM10007877_40020 [Marinibactrum halimedae]
MTLTIDKSWHTVVITALLCFTITQITPEQGVALAMMLGLKT